MATVSIPNQLEEALRVRAANEHRTVDELVGEALDWYLRIDPELLDELAGWQQVRDEALDLVEGSTESSMGSFTGSNSPIAVVANSAAADLL